jgi:hypothetical protein
MADFDISVVIQLLSYPWHQDIGLTSSEMPRLILQFNISSFLFHRLPIMKVIQGRSRLHSEVRNLVCIIERFKKFGSQTSHIAFINSLKQYLQVDPLCYVHVLQNVLYLEAYGNRISDGDSCD